MFSNFPKHDFPWNLCSLLSSGFVFGAYVTHFAQVKHKENSNLLLGRLGPNLVSHNHRTIKIKLKRVGGEEELDSYVIWTLLFISDTDLHPSV